MYEQAEPIRLPFSGPDSRQPSGPPPQPRPVRQSGSRGRVRLGNGDSDKQREDQDTSSHTYKNTEEAKRYATSADRAYPGGASGRRGVCSFLRARRSCLAAGIAVLLSLVAVGLAPLTFRNKQGISQLSAIVDALKRDQDDMATAVSVLERGQDGMSRALNALKRDQDDMTTAVSVLERGQDGMSISLSALKRDQDAMCQLFATVDALQRDLDKERDRIAALEQRLREMNKKPGYKLWREICYKVFNTRETFSEAAAACRADGGTLAMPRDAETNAFLGSLYRATTDGWSFWIGLHDRREEGSYKWVDGSALGPYSSWGPKQPNDIRGTRDCVLYSASPSGKDVPRLTGTLPTSI
ncbi:Fibrinogen C domain-containing protein 1 [Branchiostoma belcheri]|nr:Fibrinogen C domain-containing protein 1 [Branchiostoma belcheri]